jgi:hypothetical protein
MKTKEINNIAKKRLSLKRQILLAQYHLKANIKIKMLLTLLKKL